MMRDREKKGTLLPELRGFFFTILVSLFLGACSNESILEKNRIAIALESSPSNLDPRYATDANSYRLNQLLYNSLLKIDSQFNPVPDLVEKWENPDETTYWFFLKKGILFHDGSELTTEDVHYTFRTILDPSSGSPHRGAFDKVESIEPLDRYIIQYKLKEPFAPFLMNLTVIGIVPGHAAQKFHGSLANQPVGTGPFRMVEFFPDEKIILEANRDYFDGAPELDGIVFKIIPDSTVRLLELSRGKIHLLQNDIPPDLFPFLKRKKNLKIIRKEGTTYSYIGFNMEDPILKRKRVRQAIAHAIDREAIIKYILGELASPAGGILSPSNWAYEKDVQTFEYDVKKACQLLDAEGFKDPDGPDVRFTLTFKTSTDQLRRRIAEAIQQQLLEVGIGMDIRSYEWGTFYSDIKAGNFQLYTLSWVGITDPDVLYYIFHSSSIPPNGANRGRYVSPRVDSLLEEGRITVDMNTRKGIYAEVQKILAADLPYVSLWYTKNVAVMDRSVRGFVVYPAGDFFSLKDVWLETK